MVFLIFEIGRGKIRVFGWAVVWLLIEAVFGLLGIAAYLLSFRNQQTMQASGWKALGIAIFIATGNITGLILLTVFQVLFLPGESVVLLVVPAAFLVSWLAFVAPLTAYTRGIPYWKAVPQTLLTAFISTCFALAGILPVLILLTIQWFISGFNLTNSLFWITMTACGIAGAVVLYPLSFWKARRNLDFWLVMRLNRHKEAIS